MGWQQRKLDASLLVPGRLDRNAGACMRAQAVLFAAMGFKAIFKIISLTSSTIIINLVLPPPASVAFSHHSCVSES